MPRKNKQGRRAQKGKGSAYSRRRGMSYSEFMEEAMGQEQEQEQE